MAAGRIAGEAAAVINKTSRLAPLCMMQDKDTGAMLSIGAAQRSSCSRQSMIGRALPLVTFAYRCEMVACTQILPDWVYRGKIP